MESEDSYLKQVSFLEISHRDREMSWLIALRLAVVMEQDFEPRFSSVKESDDFAAYMRILDNFSVSAQTGKKANNLE